MKAFRFRRRLTVIALGSLMGLTGGSCGKNPAPVSPTTASPTTRSPTPPTPAPSDPTASYRIAANTEAPDFSPIIGARVEVIDGSQAGTFCETDQNGQCILPAKFSGAPTPEVRMTKDGFIQESVSFPAHEIRGDIVTMYF